MKKIAFVLFLIMTFYPLQKTVALSCDKPPPPEVAVHEYDVVVLATIVDKIIDENMSLEGFNTVKAEVSHPIKGYNQKLISFNEHKLWSNSKVGMEYLLFLYKEDDGYVLSNCGLTAETSGLDMDNLLDFLTKEVEAANEVTSVPNTAGESEFSWQWILTISMVLVIVAIYFRRKRRSAIINEK